MELAFLALVAAAVVFTAVGVFFSIDHMRVCKLVIKEQAKSPNSQEYFATTRKRRSKALISALFGLAGWAAASLLSWFPYEGVNYLTLPLLLVQILALVHNCFWERKSKRDKQLSA